MILGQKIVGEVQQLGLCMHVIYWEIIIITSGGEAAAANCVAMLD